MAAGIVVGGFLWDLRGSRGLGNGPGAPRALRRGGVGLGRLFGAHVAGRDFGLHSIGLVSVALEEGMRLCPDEAVGGRDNSSRSCLSVAPSDRLHYV